MTDYTLAGTPVSDVGSERLPAAVHVDATTRPQEVDPSSDELLAELLDEWGDRAGGALINTSFNGPGEPIVSSVADAAAAFRRLGLDFLMLDGELLTARPTWWRRA